MYVPKRIRCGFDQSDAWISLLYSFCFPKLVLHDNVNNSKSLPRGLKTKSHLLKLKKKGLWKNLELDGDLELIPYSQVLLFYTSLKHQKTFRGYRKATPGCNGLTSRYRFLELEIWASLTFETFNVTEQIEAHFLRCFLLLECKYKNWEKESFLSRNRMGFSYTYVKK